MRPALVLAIVLTLTLVGFDAPAALGQTPAPSPTPAPTSFSVSGSVWEDTNGDGIRQASEKGMFVPLELGRIEGGAAVYYGSGGLPIYRDANGRVVRSDADGVYSFANLPAGSYVVRIGLGGAGNPYFMTFPIRRGGGEYSIALTVGPQSPSEVNFGLQFVQAQTAGFRGIAWIDGAPAPGNSGRPDVRAFIDGIDCTAPGGLLPTDQQAGTYIVGVASSSLIAGCGEAGKPVRFTVNGLAANEIGTWQPRPTGPFFVAPPDQPQPEPREISLSLTVGAPFAYFFSSAAFSSEDGSGRIGYIDAANLRAYVDGNDCSRIRGGVWASIIVVIASREMQPGCGYEGAAIRLELSGVPVGGPLVWHAGRIDGPEALPPDGYIVVPVDGPGVPPPLPPGGVRPPSVGDGGLVP